MNEAIVFENVDFAYDEGEKNVVEDLSFKVERGSFVALVGRNASGKSTVAKLVNGLIAPLSGKITVLGLDATDENNSFEIRKRCGIVFQNPDNQTVATIVEDDVAFGPENIGVEREEIGKRIDFALKATGTESFRFSSASRLSGGQKQRVAIAGVLAIKPEILILDESTSMLDPRGRCEVFDTVRRLNREMGITVVKNLNKLGMTVIVITHYMDEVTDCDEVLVMGGGRLLRSGTPEEIFADEDLLARAGLELPVPAKIAKLLRKKGVKIGQPLTKEALKDELCVLLQET